ncbi:MAG TPA: hypothetical protein PKD54_09615 [Pirellulaceae bacterium]|nr:hypothetical protein [Pirellulaceae bacterium]
MTKSISQVVQSLFRLAFTGVVVWAGMFGAANAQVASRVDGLKARPRNLDGVPGATPIQSPAPTQQAAPNALVGVWHFRGGDQNNSVDLVFAFAANGSYEMVLVTTKNGRREDQYEKGQWAADAKQLATRSEANENGLYDYQVSSNRLVLEFLMDGQTMRMEFNRVEPNQVEQAPPSGPTTQPVHQQPARMPSLVGTWHCQGVLEGSEIYVRATFSANGGLRIDMQIGTPQGVVNMSGQGTWSIQGNVLSMSTELGDERVPFEFRGEKLFLDYSMVGFTLEMVRVNEGR